MGLETLLRKFTHFSPWNEELNRVKTRYSMPISLIKIFGIGGMGLSFHYYGDNRKFIASFLASLGVYATGVVADYIAIKKADAKIKEKALTDKYQKQLEERAQEDELENEIMQRYPVLEELKFRYLDIDEVALHIYSSIKGKSINEIREIFPFFAYMEIKNLSQYLDLLKQQHTGAIAFYRKTLKVLE